MTEPSQNKGTLKCWHHTINVVMESGSKVLRKHCIACKWWRGGGAESLFPVNAPMILATGKISIFG